MRIILALICFIAMLMHAFFGYFLYVRGESVFEPENMIVAVQKKVSPNVNKLSIFQKKSDHIDDPVVKEQAKNATFYEKPDDGLIKTEEKTQGSENSVSSGSSVDSAAASTETKKEGNNPSVAEPSKEEIAKPAEETKEYLPFNTGWSGTLQVENALITIMLFFLGFSICCVKGRGPASRWVFAFNFLFWGTLGGAIWFFLPANTPLVIFNIKYSFPQWYLVLGMCGLAAVLSFLLFLNAFRKPIEAKQAAEKSTPKTAASAEDVKQEPARHRFSFGRNKEEKTEEMKSEPTVAVTPPPVIPTPHDATDKRPE